MHAESTVPHRWGAVGNGAGRRTTALTDAERPYYVERIAARPAARAVDESDVDVAIIDSGVDTDHPDLNGTLAWGVNTYALGGPFYGLEHVEDYNGHGTAVAGPLAAEADGSGIVGVAPDVDFYIMKAGNGSNVSAFAGVEAIKIALKGPDGERGTADDADVISMSYGGDGKFKKERRLIRNVTDDVVLVASAGNDGDGDPSTGEVGFPAGYPGVIAVGGTDGTGEPSPQASEGAPVDIAAPTHDAKVTYLDGEYVTVPYGTSVAAPQVAGAVALLVAKYGQMGTAEARRLLTSNATDIPPAGEDNFTGAGRLNVSRTLGVPAPGGGDDDDGGDGGDEPSDPTPNVDITDVSIPETAVAGDSVFVTVTVEPDSDVDGGALYNLTVSVNGSPRARISGAVQALERDSGAALVNLTEPGRANVSIAGERNGIVEVAPNPTAVSIDVPDETLAGAPTPIDVSVSNTGTETYERTVTVRTGTDRIAKPTVTVGPGETVTTTVSTRFDELGTHTVVVVNRTGHRRSDTVRVTPAVTITDVSAPDLDRPGELEADVTLDNVGPADRTVRLRASVNNSTVDNTTVRPTVDANSTDTAFLRLDLPANGTYELAIDRPNVANDTVTRVVRVGPTDDSPGDNETPTGAVPSVSVDAGPGAVVNGTATLTLSVTNVGDRPADLASLQLTDLPEVLDVRHVRTAGATLNGTDGRFGVGDRVVFDDPIGAPDVGPPAPGDTRRATVVLDIPESVPAGLTLSVTVAASVNDSVRTDSATVDLPTLDPDSPARFDRDGDDRIETAEVLDAIAAYRAGDSVGGHPVTARDVLGTVAAFGTTV